MKIIVTYLLAAVLLATALPVAGCDGGFALGGQIISVKVYQNSPLATTRPADADAPIHNESHVTISNEDGGTSFMGPSANPTATTQPAK